MSVLCWSCALWSPSGTFMREAGLDCREPAASRGQPGVGIGTRSVGLLLRHLQQQVQELRPTARVWLGKGPSAAAQATKHCEQLRATCWIWGPGRPRCAGWFPSLQPQTCEHISVMATAGRGEPLSPRAGLSGKRSFCSGQEARRPTSLPRKAESCALRSGRVRPEATSCGPGHQHPLPDREPGIRPTP